MFLHTVAVQEQAVGADGIFTFEMPVNPLSALIINLRPLNDTGTLANMQSYRGIAAAMNRCSLIRDGQSIRSFRGEDLAAWNYFRHGMMPFQGQHDDTNNERRCVSFPMILGRWPYDKKSALPASRRGELILELDLDLADTGYDTLRVSVDSIELLDSSPTEFEKITTITQTFAATGDQDVDLPVGNLVRGLLLFGTTPFAGATPAPSWGRIRTLLDNREIGYGGVDFEVAQMIHCLWGRQPPYYDGHMHRVTTDGNAQTELATVSGPFNVGAGIAGAVDINSWMQYAFLDFDPTGDDAHALDTSGAKRFNLRANAETADAIRVLVCERLAARDL